MSHKYRRRKVKPKVNPNWVNAPCEVWFIGLQARPPELGGPPAKRSVSKDPIPYSPYKIIKPGPFNPK